MSRKKRKKTTKSKRKGTSFERDMDKIGDNLDKTINKAASSAGDNIFGSAKSFDRLGK